MGGTSAPIGTSLDSFPDTPGPSGNEINDADYIPYSNGTTTGSLSINLGYLLTTFNDEYWYQPPVNVPGTTDAIFINMGNISISPNTPMTAQTFTNLVNQALGGPKNGGLSAAAKTAVGNFLTKTVSAVGSTGHASIVPCFSAPWDGKS